MFDTAVLIAAAGLQPALRASLSAEAREVLSFSDSEALRALETISSRRPGLVALERGFASSSRGIALMNRIKADPALAVATIRVVIAESSDAQQPAKTPEATRAATTPAEPPAPPQPDFRGTRRAQRFTIDPPMDVLVDGKRGSLVDLSTRGAQVVTGAALKPKQRVRISLPDDQGTIRGVATVVWALFEMPKGAGPRYRVGLNFIDLDVTALEAYVGRHKASH